jgi:hypothetical protein
LDEPVTSISKLAYDVIIQAALLGCDLLEEFLFAFDELATVVIDEKFPKR